MRGSPRFPMSEPAKLLESASPIAFASSAQPFECTSVTNASKIANLLNFQASVDLLVTERTLKSSQSTI